MGKFVLAAVPVFIPYRYGARPPYGDFRTQEAQITNLEGATPYTGLFHTFETLESNNFGSFHHTLEGTRSTANNPLGANLTNVDKEFLAKLGVDPLAESIFVKYKQLRCNSPDYKLVGGVIVDKSILDKWAEQHDAQALLVQHGLKKPAPQNQQGTAQNQSTTSQTQTQLTKPAPVISAPAQFALNKYALALVKLAPNQAGEISGEAFSPTFSLDVTFTTCVTTPTQVNPHMLNARISHFCGLLRGAELFQYSNLKCNTLNKAAMSQLSIGA